VVVVVGAPIATEANTLFFLTTVQKHESDIKAILKGKTKAVDIIGAAPSEFTLAYLGKALHFILLVGVPVAIHGVSFLPTYFAFGATGSVVLAWLFAISHNLEEAKEDTPEIDNDWGQQQIAHSANYGGAFEGYLTGGLNLQIGNNNNFFLTKDCLNNPHDPRRAPPLPLVRIRPLPQDRQDRQGRVQEGQRPLQLLQVTSPIFRCVNNYFASLFFFLATSSP